MQFLKIAALRLRRKMVMFFVLIFIASVCSLVVYKIAEQQLSEEKIQLDIALLNLDKSSECEGILNFVFNIPEIKESYNIIKVETEQEGVDLVGDESAYALVILPENFIKNLFSGREASPKIIKSPTPSVHSSISNELMNIVVKGMQDTQSGIYTASDFTYAQFGELDEKFVLDSNYAFVKEIMFRSRWFKVTDLSFEKVLPINIHYALALAVFFMLISSAIFYSELNIGRDFLVLKQLRSVSNEHHYLRLSQVLIVFLLYFSILIAITIGLGGKVTFISVLSIINATILFMATQLLIFSIFSQYITAMLINIVLQVINLFIAGGIIPTLFLPEIVQRFSFLSPIRNIIDLVAAGFVDLDKLWIHNIVVLVVNIILITIVFVRDDRQLDRRTSYEATI